MKRFHQILGTTIDVNLEQCTNIAEALQFLLKKFPKEEIQQHLKFSRQKIRSYFQASFGPESVKDMEIIERSLKKLQKGDFSLYSELIAKGDDLKDFYMDPEERDQLQLSKVVNQSNKIDVMKHKKIRKQLQRFPGRRDGRYHNQQ